MNRQHLNQLVLSVIQAALAGIAFALSMPAAALDICGCAGHPDSLGAFDIQDSATYPPGSTFNGANNGGITIPLPEDGVLIFDSFRVVSVVGFTTHVKFVRNNDNTPVRILVAGDVLVGGGTELSIDGADASGANSNVAGIGGAPGPGGYRGGNGAALGVNGASDGGAGLGPGGGAAGTGNPLVAGGDGVFIGRSELRPLVGSSGGGGGGSNATGNCSAGGGGGGGGALLLVADGTVTVNGTINADGGNLSGSSNGACASNGGRGGGGAIRILADTITGSGSMLARAGRSNSGPFGVIRMESIDNSFRQDGAIPRATRLQQLFPLANPVTPAVAITAVQGSPSPAVLQGPNGGVDFVLDAPGVVTLQLETTDVPAGTTVDVAVKPRLGGAVLRDTVTLETTACTNDAVCTAFATFDLPSNVYFAEAQATFQTP